MTHPTEEHLALFASGDAGFLRGALVARHLRGCPSCSAAVEEYRELTAALANDVLVVPDWNQLAAEMRANIRVGLEAGACVGDAVDTGWWNPRLAVAMASLLILAGAGFMMRTHPQPQAALSMATATQHSVSVDTEGVTITNVILE